MQVDESEPIVSRYTPLLETTSVKSEDTPSISCSDKQYEPPPLTTPLPAPGVETKVSTTTPSVHETKATGVEKGKSDGKTKTPSVPFSSFNSFLTCIMRERAPKCLYPLQRLSELDKMTYSQWLQWQRSDKPPNDLERVFFGCILAIREGEDYHAHLVLTPYLKKFPFDPLAWIALAYAPCMYSEKAVDTARRAVQCAQAYDETPCKSYLIGMAIMTLAEAHARKEQYQDALLCLRLVIEVHGIRYAMLSRIVIYQLQADVNKCRTEIERVEQWLRDEMSSRPEQASEHLRIKRLVDPYRQWIIYMTNFPTVSIHPPPTTLLVMGTSSYFRFVTGTKRHGVRVNWTRVKTETMKYFCRADSIDVIKEEHMQLPEEAQIIHYLPFQDETHPFTTLMACKPIRDIMGAYLDAGCSSLTTLGRMMDELKIHGYWYPDFMDALLDIVQNGLEWLCNDGYTEQKMDPMAVTVLSNAGKIRKRKAELSLHALPAPALRKPEKTEKQKSVWARSDEACQRLPYPEEVAGPIQLHFDVPEDLQMFFIEIPEPVPEHLKEPREVPKDEIFSICLAVCSHCSKRFKLYASTPEEDKVNAEKKAELGADKRYMPTRTKVLCKTCRNPNILVFIHNWVDDIRILNSDRGDSDLMPMILADYEEVRAADECDEKDHSHCMHPRFDFTEEDTNYAKECWYRQQSVRNNKFGWMRFMENNQRRISNECGITYLGAGRFGQHKRGDKIVGYGAGPM